MKILSAAALSFAAIAMSACQNNSGPEPQTLSAPRAPTYDKGQTFLRTSFFEALEAYEDADVKSGRKGFYGQKLSMAGREDILRQDGVIRPSRFTCDEVVGDASAPLTEQILNVIGDAQIVIINEDHKIARHRETIRAILPDLRDAGFTAYAAETFSEYTDTMSPDRVTMRDGFYISEPTFGRLVNAAKNLGFTLVPYEQRDDQTAPEDADRSARIEARETAQSGNLAAFLSENPDTKILVHVGHSHVAEIPIPNSRDEGSTEWMASKFKNLTGLDPVTLSQTACKTTAGLPILSDQKRNSSGATALMLTDYTIAYPVPDESETRGDWRRARGDIEVALPEAWVQKNKTKTLLFEARPISAPDEDVPSDRILIRESEETLPLLLPPGDYRVNAFDNEGDAETPVEITVSKP